MYLNKIFIMTLLMNAFAASAFLRNPRQSQENDLTMADAAQALDKKTLPERILQVSGTYAIQNLAHSAVLDSNADGSVYPEEFNGGSWQKWNLNCDGNKCRLQNLATGLFLDSNTGKEVYALSNNGSSFQLWELSHSTGDDTWILKNVATSFVLDSGGGDVYTSEYNGGSFQKWKFSSV
jgi:Ricin-type beta-trefoil lectin domain-like